MYARKQEQTKQQLHTALITLLATTRFEKITVNQLAQQAKVTRSTFYRYYDDKYDLLAAIEETTIKALVTMPAGQPLGDELDQVLINYQANFKTLHALLGANGDPAFTTRLEHRMNQLFYPDQPRNVETAMIQVATTAMWMRVLHYWVFHETTTPVVAVKKVTQDVLQAVGAVVRDNRNQP